MMNVAALKEFTHFSTAKVLNYFEICKYYKQKKLMGKKN